MVQGINNINLLIGKPQAPTTQQVGVEGTTFGDLLEKAMDKITELDRESQNMQVAFAQGENIELHEVVIAMEKYSIAVELLMAVRNKIIEAYQEISRMPV